MFGGHSHSGSGVMILVWHTILQDQLFKGSCNFMGGNPSGYAPQAKYGGQSHCGS